MWSGHSVTGLQSHYFFPRGGVRYSCAHFRGDPGSVTPGTLRSWADLDTRLAQVAADTMTTAYGTEEYQRLATALQEATASTKVFSRTKFT